MTKLLARLTQNWSDLHVVETDDGAIELQITTEFGVRMVFALSTERLLLLRGIFDVVLRKRRADELSELRYGEAAGQVTLAMYGGGAAAFVRHLRRGDG